MTADQKIESKLSFAAPVDSLLEAATKVMSVVPTKSPKPVLTNIKFSVYGGRLELTGADTGFGIYYAVPAAVIGTEGVGLLNGVTLLEFLKEFRGADATISFDPRGGCRFKSSGGAFKMVGEDPHDYPSTPRYDHHSGLKLSGSDLVDMVKKTAFAIAEEESRMSTNGVLFEHKAGRFRLVSTDNRRIAITERMVEAGTPDFSVSVPPAFLKALLKVTSKDVAGDQATIGVDNHRIFFRLAVATVYGSVLEGRFPPYEEGLKVVLKEHIDCGVATMLATLRRACLVDKSLCALNFSKDMLRLRSTSTNVGDGSAEMSIHYQGPDVRVGFNPVLIREGLEAMTSKRCRFLFQGPRNAGVLREVLSSSDGTEAVSDRFVYAVMPTLLQSSISSPDD